ncbi:MAG: phospholipid carrier-dependent glycosyltransferase, partial [Cyanothece sp. SIO1E1]|nr:phospholipid carrier-dependent glycosyltransferase [Cyanothece sp. SIO1E1]
SLGKYLIAMGMWLTDRLPLPSNLSLNDLSGSLRSPISYRWMNALAGSLMPLVVAGIAYQLSHRRSYAWVASLFTAVDGLLLVESRYALINIYLVLFGLLGHWFFLSALNSQAKQRKIWLVAAGISMGACIAVKWNGLGFLLGLYLLWLLAKLIWQIQPQTAATIHPRCMPWQNLGQLQPSSVCFYLGVLPAWVYVLFWIPHLRLNPSNFWTVHADMLSYHLSLGADAHPACSAWYTWPFMMRPVTYVFRKAYSLTEPIDALGPTPPPENWQVAYDVHAMGNPILWWLSTAAILLMAGFLIQQVWILLKHQQNLKPIAHRLSPIAYHPSSHPNPRPKSHPLPIPSQVWIPFYLVVNYAANWLPWAGVERCLFLYHYMTASVFALMAIAWLVSRWLQHPQPKWRIAGAMAILLVLLAFVFWLPIYLGLPLSPEAWRSRWWIASWQ